MNHADFLVEIHTEELPPKSIEVFAQAFKREMKERLQKVELGFKDLQAFATPRRLAVLVRELAPFQPDQVLARRGPALTAAFDKAGKPTPACVGFARSCGVTPEELTTFKNDQGEWVFYQQKVKGKPVLELLPLLVEQAASALPIPKRMRWGDNDAQFTRPIHSVIMLYGQDIVSGEILGYSAGRKTRGHRFHAPQEIEIPDASQYEAILEKAFVIADFEKRRDDIVKKASQLFDENLHLDEGLLAEVTGLVEWPVALLGKFDAKFLPPHLPEEVLIASMKDHQRYFPVFDKAQKILPQFIVITNIESHDATRIIRGNERVLRARLSDAAFFFETDKKEKLDDRIERLKGMVFQAKLGTLYDKAERLSQLAAHIAKQIKANEKDAIRAGMLAKTDLTTNMVGEFPELQGVMGYYYALNQNEAEEVAIAIKEHYLPRFAGDQLPQNTLGKVLALADRIDTLVGTFGINQIPTGDKDPYGLRRAVLGVIRILIENKFDVDLREILSTAQTTYTVTLDNSNTVAQLLSFIQERLRAWYQDQGVAAEIFASVAALEITNPYDLHKRIQAVQAFKKLAEAETLSIANKRVSNILAKYTDNIKAKAVNPDFFDNAAEKELATQLQHKSKIVGALSKSGDYEAVLMQLADLKKPIDDFFDQVMVMTDDKNKRENRILLLSQLRSLFLQVADIAFLQ